MISKQAIMAVVDTFKDGDDLAEEATKFAHSEPHLRKAIDSYIEGYTDIDDGAAREIARDIAFVALFLFAKSSEVQSNAEYIQGFKAFQKRLRENSEN